MEENKGQAPAQTEVKEPKKISFTAKLIIGCVGVLAVLILAMLIVSNHKTKVNLSKYVTITYSGYNTVGHASAYVDYAKLASDYRKNLKSDNTLEQLETGVVFYAVANGSLDKTEGLSNGDEVVFSWNRTDETDKVLKEFESKYKLKLVYKNVKSKVKDLETAQVCDPFEGLELTFSGYSGYGSVYYESTNAKIKGLTYSISPEKNLSNGDEVTVIAKAPGSTSLEDYCMTYGYVPGQKEKTYTVSGLEDIKDYDLFADVEVTFNGVSSIGKVSINSDKVKLGDIHYTADATSGLKNGDTVTITAYYSGWSYNSLEEYLAGNGYKAAETEMTVTVSGLTEPETIDPFEGLELTFTGISTEGRLEIYKDDVIFSKLNYNADTYSGLENGDKVTITVTAPWGAELDSYCLENGYILESTEKTVTVSGLSYYADALDQIPDDDIDNMDGQVRDYMKSKVASDWVDKDSFKKMELINIYLLYPKSMSNRVYANYLYLVYKISVDDEDAGKFSYYFYAEYRDILCLDDGSVKYELMSFGTPSDNFRKEGKWYKGYEKLSELYNKCVTSKVDKYKSEEKDMQ